MKRWPIIRHVRWPYLSRRFNRCREDAQVVKQGTDNRIIDLGLDARENDNGRYRHVRKTDPRPSWAEHPNAETQSP